MNNKKNFFIVFNITIWFILGIILLIGVMPETPIMIDKNFRKQIKIVLPDRWPFFTKDPREDYIFLLKKTSKGYVFHENFPNSSSSNYFGLVSSQKAVGLEYGIISSQIDNDLWYINNTGKNLFQIINNDTIKILEIKKTKEISKLIGEFVFIKIEPLPYMWRDKVKQFEMPSKFVKIKIR